MNRLDIPKMSIIWFKNGPGSASQIQPIHTSDLGDLSSGKLTLVGERFRNIVSTMVP